ncbi:uncharacterized protein LOC129794529 [Lutzomyia longipalpis]|uniref:uncharacterized protein LOC129794529 n=1 Tax=Lutzomyia longipalpis TaxID=7200 RepID=UPI0024842C04|nr:uncharacterized protein LOC129794529 [Lutzomyia longipalpis]
MNDGGQCEKIMAKWLTTCRDGEIRELSLLQKNALENTPMTLNDCNLKFCCQISPPFVNEGCSTGIEISMLRIIQAQMKFDTKIQCTNMSRGEIEDGVPTNLLNELVERRCDVLIGSFFPDNDLENFGESVTYLEDSYTWFAPLADHRAPWKGLLAIFLTSTWMLILFSFVMAGTIWYILGKYSQHEDRHHGFFILCMLNAWQLSLSISANNRPQCIPLRTVFLTLALYALNINTIYTSKLITVFTHPAYEDQIDSLNKILTSGLPFGGPIEYLDWFMNDEPIDQTISKSFNTSINFQRTLESLERVKEGKQILLANRMFVLSNQYNSKIFGFPENVFSNPMEIITTKGFPLLLNFNDVISILKDCGILFKLYNDFIYNITIISQIKSPSKNGEFVVKSFFFYFHY